MALKLVHKETEFGIGDTIRVHQSIAEGNKRRLQVFEGMVIAISGKGEGKNFVVRRIGSAQVGIEKIFPLNAPLVEKIEVVRSGLEGVRRAKLYYTRDISKKETEKIYQRKTKKERAQKLFQERKKVSKKTTKKASA